MSDRIIQRFMLSWITYFQMDKREENVLFQNIWPHLLCFLFLIFFYLKRFLKNKKKEKRNNKKKSPSDVLNSFPSFQESQIL